jgi:hypothetical protein
MLLLILKRNEYVDLGFGDFTVPWSVTFLFFIWDMEVIEVKTFVHL